MYFFYEILNSLKTVDEVKNFLKDILTLSELRMIKRRWHIAGLLFEGLDIRTVAYKSKTSTQTVSKIKRVLEEGHGGLVYALMLEKAKQKTEYVKLKKIKRGSSKYVKSWF